MTDTDQHTTASPQSAWPSLHPSAAAFLPQTGRTTDVPVIMLFVVPDSPVPAEPQPQSIAAEPSGSVLIASNNQSRKQCSVSPNASHEARLQQGSQRLVHPVGRQMQVA